MNEFSTKNTGLKRVFKAFGYSLQGFKATWQQEAAFRQEVILALLALPLAFWLGESLQDYLILIGVLFLVLIVEILNSSIESTINRIGTEHHQLSGQAKDQASAAVLLALTLAGIVYLGYLINKLI